MFSSALKSFSSNIASHYQISPDPILTCGPWKIHDGKKKSTSTSASIFIFDRKILEPRTGAFGSRSSSSSLKKTHDEVVDRLKREVSSLTRLRHPSILQVLEPVEETRSGGLMFATEPITASLASLLQDKNAQEGGARSSRFMVESADGTRRRREVEIDELEVQKGLLQIAKGLEFLHESAGLVHGNLNPEAIYINAKSDWKISGLAFAGPPDTASSQSTLPPLALSEVLYQDARLPPSVQLDLDYTSPDFVLDSNVTTAADLFSLGLIIIAIYNSPHTSPLQTQSSIATYKKLLSTPSTTPSQSNSFLCTRPIPKDLLAHVLPRLITRRPAQRMNAREFQQSPYFDNILVSTIRFLESLPAKTQHEKSQFLRGLKRVIPEFPASVLERKVLGVLLEEAKDRELLSLILQNVFRILKKLPNGRRVFPETVIPKLKDIFLTGSKGAAPERDTIKDAGLMVVLENIDVVADNCSGKEFKEDILPLIQLGMDSPTHSLVDAAMKCLPDILPVLDFSTVKNEVFPPVASTFSKTSSLAIKIRGLEAFVVLCGGSAGKEADLSDDLSGVIDDKRPNKRSTASILDKYTIQEKLVPLLKAIKTKEPGVMMATLDVFKQVGKLVDTEFLALEVLPILWSCSLGPLLNPQQFNEFMALIKSLSTKIEREHSKKLQELSSRDEATPSRNGLESTLGAGDNFGASNAEATANDFERLVLGRNGTSNTNGDNLWDGWSSEPAAAAKPANSVTSPTFSWSSNPSQSVNRSTVTTRSNAYSSAGQTPRSITPDSTINAFPSLEPTRQGSTKSTASQAWKQSTPSWNQTNPVSAPPLTPNIGSTPSFAALEGMGTSSFGQTSRQAPNYSPFSIPPPPANSSQQARHLSSSALPTAGKAWVAHSTEGIPSQSITSAQNAGQPKQGLDKYASLL